MAVVKREKNCSNCDNCVSGAQRRFRCIALPSKPNDWWDGFPEEHACSIHWIPKKDVKGPIKATQEK